MKTTTKKTSKSEIVHFNHRNKWINYVAFSLYKSSYHNIITTHHFSSKIASIHILTI